MVRAAAFGVGALLVLVLAAYELGQPLAAIQFMWKVRAVNWQIVALTAPGLLAAIASILSVFAAYRMLRERRTMEMVLILSLAIAVLPIIAGVGHGLIQGLLRG